MSLNESIVEDAALEWFVELGYAVGHGPHLAPGEPKAERDSFSDVVLVGRLKRAAALLNPGLPASAIDDGVRRLLRRESPSLVAANRQFHRFLVDGVPVQYRRPDGSTANDLLRLVDFDHADANDWLAVNQFTVVEGGINRRPDVVVFLNSDCTPTDASWLERLLAAGSDPAVAAVFGRQIPRPGCHPIHALDTERAYGDGARHRTWRHFFSMASSAIRRPVWESMPFDEALRYSEDIDWTWRARRAGFQIRYVPEAVVLHSHDYTLRQLYRRHAGEGRADANIFDWSSWERNLVRYSLLPWGRQVLADWRELGAMGQWKAAIEAPVVRAAQMAGRRAGFIEGWKERTR